MADAIIKPVTNDIASCNCCEARNYEGAYLTRGHIVPVIFDIKVGIQVVRICPDCLRKLIGTAENALKQLTDITSK